MIRTRVGYAGGRKEKPTYHSLGDHSETIQIDYDPTLVSYEELLDVFWSSHNPRSRPFSRQYASVVFYHDEEQERLARETKAQEEAQGGRIWTDILPASEFYLAEDYHQKYQLRRLRELEQEFTAIYPDSRDLTDSTAAARVNGYLGGHGTFEQLQAEIEGYGLSPTASKRLLDIAAARQGVVGQCPLPQS